MLLPQQVSTMSTYISEGQFGEVYDGVVTELNGNRNNVRIHVLQSVFQ
jgi:hypothetical protein